MNGGLFLLPGASSGPPGPPRAPEANPVSAAERTAVPVNELFAAHAAFLVRAIERITGDLAQAEDIVQEAFLIAHRRRAELRADGNPRAWLYRVAMNLLRTSRRSFARELRFLVRITGERRVERSGGEPDQLALERERAQRVSRAVARLPMVHREVFVLFELEGLSGAEIGALLEVPVATVWTRLHRARAAFRRAWPKEEAS